MIWITNEIKEILHQAPPWRGFRFKVTESAEGIFLLVKKDELSKFSGPQQEDLSAWMAGMCNKIRNLKVPCYIMEWK